MAKQTFEQTIKEFSHANKNFLVIAADPKTNQVFCGYKDKMVLGELKDKFGMNWPMVQTMLSKTRFAAGIDVFLGWILATLEIPVNVGKQFLAFIDGALYHITGYALFVGGKDGIMRKMKESEKVAETSTPKNG